MSKRIMWQPYVPGRYEGGVGDRRVVHGRARGEREQRDAKRKKPRALAPEFGSMPTIEQDMEPEAAADYLYPTSLPMAVKEDSDALQQRVNIYAADEAALAAQLAAAQADAKAAADAAELNEKATVYTDVLKEFVPEVFHSPRKSMVGYTPGSLKTPIEVGSWRGGGTVSASGGVGLVTAAALRFSPRFSPLSVLLSSPVIQNIVRRHTHSLTLALARVRRPTRTSFTVPRAFCVRVCVADGRHSGGHPQLCR